MAAWTSGCVPIHQPMSAASSRGEECGRYPPVAGAVDRGRETRGEEAGGVAPGGAAGAGHRAAGACHELGEAAGELRVGGAGLDQGEVGGGALVEGDEFVGLRAGEAAPAAQQVRPGGPTRHGGR